MAVSREPLRLGSKIVAVGRNYVAHALELKNAVPTVPLLFLKPVSSAVAEPGSIEVTPDVHVDEGFHHEVELGVVIGKRAKRVAEADALDYVAGYCVALDMTARNVQAEAKKAGMPWMAAKCRDTWTPLGPFVPKEDVPDPEALRIWCKVDGDVRQDGRTENMIFKIPYLLEYVSSMYTLEPGDIVLTGTPEGVGPVRPGQVISAGIDGLTEMSFPIVEVE